MEEEPASSSGETEPKIDLDKLKRIREKLTAIQEDTELRQRLYDRQPLQPPTPEEIAAAKRQKITDASDEAHSRDAGATAGGLDSNKSSPK